MSEPLKVSVSKPVAQTGGGLSDLDWQQLALWLAAADIDCIELDTPTQSLRMVRRSDAWVVETQPAAAQPAAAQPEVVTVSAPCAGLLLDRHPLADVALAPPGTRVRAGDVLALLQIGLVLAPVTAPQDGTVARWLVPSGTLVGYGTGLLELVKGDA